MTAIFDGMAGLLSGVFGGAVIFHPASGPARSIQSIFRESPIEIDSEDGQIVQIDAPTWRVSRDLAPEVQRGDRITVADGRDFVVMVVHPSGSPAADAFLICECQIAEWP